LAIYARANNPDKIFDWQPDQVDFDEILIGQKAKMVAKLTNTDSVEAEINIVSEPTSEYVKKLKIKKTKLRPGQSTDIEIELNNNIAPDAIKTALTLEAKGRDNTRITIPITGRIVEHLTPKVEKPDNVADKKANSSSQLSAGNKVVPGKANIKKVPEAAQKPEIKPVPETTKMPEVEPTSNKYYPESD
jgi:hypothetical protein